MVSPELKIQKSARHAKITGNFGEAVILYWLSKYGFECALVDHTGIDIIARNPYTQERMGISVKSRSRNRGKEEEHVSIANDNFEKAEGACSAFGCIPYFAIVVDAGDTIQGFLLPMKHLLELFPRGKTASGWKMRKSDLEKYRQDSEIRRFVFTTKTFNWWEQA
ncbi:MAG: hypothetical protein A2V67_20330 [Deltaproteobacteria bacterium RBG_13_61_14]|nr:MAG: hypothetical protein A2V67_20330 [Deltaproteobacteria bacterium RBG_13_61_14]